MAGLLKPETREVGARRRRGAPGLPASEGGVDRRLHVTGQDRAQRPRAIAPQSGTDVCDGKLGSLRRFKDDVREVAAGFECGISLEGFDQLLPGDIIESYRVEEIARTL